MLIYLMLCMFTSQSLFFSSQLLFLMLLQINVFLYSLSSLLFGMMDFQAYSALHFELLFFRIINYHFACSGLISFPITCFVTALSSCLDISSHRTVCSLNILLVILLFQIIKDYEAKPTANQCGRL